MWNVEFMWKIQERKKFVWDFKSENNKYKLYVCLNDKCRASVEKKSFW